MARVLLTKKVGSSVVTLKEGIYVPGCDYRIEVRKGPLYYSLRYFAEERDAREKFSFICDNIDQFLEDCSLPRFS